MEYRSHCILHPWIIGYDCGIFLHLLLKNNSLEQDRLITPSVLDIIQRFAQHSFLLHFICIP